MIGSIIGDIVGSFYEFNNIKHKDFPLFNKGCRFTDDTVMTLAVAKALLISNDDYSDLRKNTIEQMVKIGRNYPHCGYSPRFFEFIMSDNHEAYNSCGDGAAMRISPVGFLAKDTGEAKKLSNIVTSVSHNHIEGLKGAESVAVSMVLLRQGTSLEELKKYINEHYYKIDFTIDEIRPSYKFEETCQNTIPQAFECLFESTSYIDAIRTAISLGGDSDTLACIVGAMAECYYGVPLDLRSRALEYLNKELQDILIDFENKYPMHEA